MENRLFEHSEVWEKLRKKAICRTFPSKTVLLRDGDTSHDLYFIEKGSLRLCFNKDGKEITFQLFFEGQGVSSIESFFNDTPSIFSIETIEASTVLILQKQDVMEYFETCNKELQRFIIGRLINYTHLFLSRIKNSPQERYEELIKNNPEILKRIPQHYIASYLGITPVSLSRIRNRIY